MGYINTRMAMAETKKAFENNWLSIALGSFLWNLYIIAFLVGGAILGGLIIWGIDETNIFHDLIEEIILIVILLSANGPFSAGYTNFIVEAIRHKKINYNLLFSGFRNFRKTFLIGFYSWGILMIGVILFLFFIVVLNTLFPAVTNNTFLRIIVVGFITIVLLILELRILWIPYFIYQVRGQHDSAWEIVKKSWNLMDGNEMILFKLLLRFVGWNFIAVITFGIGWFWVYPYTVGSIYFFYHDLKNKMIAEKLHNKNKIEIIPIEWSTEKTFTIIFIILFWSFFIGLAFS